MKRLVVVLPSLLLLACSGRATSDALGVADAGAAVAAPLDGAAAVRARIVAAPALRGRLPGGADAPLRLVTPDGATLSVRARGLAAVSGEPTEGALVFRDVAPETDLMLAAAREGVEEVRVLRGPTAPTTLRWSIEVGGDRSVRVREGIAEVVDAHGHVAIAAARPFAVDARGERRSLAWRREGAELVAALDVGGLAYPILVDPLWTTIAPMPTTRSGFATTLLASGKVLAIGGVIGSTPTSVAEIYDPATNTWAAAGAGANARSSPTAVLLTAGAYAGKVFVVGGLVPTYEIYDPIAKSGTVLGPTTPAFVTLSAAGGNVLAHDGSTVQAWSSATNAWTTPGGTFTHRLNGWSATTLADGRVAILGGGSGAFSTGAVDVYRPATNDFFNGTGGTPVQGHAAALLANGTQVLMAGGTSAAGSSTSVVSWASVYDATANAWIGGAALAVGRPTAAAGLLPNGKIAVAGGGSTTVEVYNPTTAAFELGPDAPSASLTGTALPISTGALFVPGLQLYAPYALGAACYVGFECMSGNCVTGACCSTSSCTTGARCDIPTMHGVCAKPNGVACAAGSECGSGLCVDGVCCNAACGGECQACDVTGSVGTCAPVYGAPHGTRAACTGAASSDVCQRQICNGVDTAACHFAPALTVPCGANACTGGSESHTATCDDGGHCSDVPRSCGVYVCGSTACLSSCAADADCVAGYYCDTASSACVPRHGLGQKCSATAPCASALFCTDGVCCGVSSCGASGTCAAPGHEGTCRHSLGVACASNDDCGSGSCVDGVCCDGACTGACEACDVAGSVGECTPVTGAPHGARPACAAGGADACAATSCDGADRAHCAAHPGSETTCRPQSCHGATLTAPALCDGSGACPTAVTSSCHGYRCSEAAGVCATSCKVDGDCDVGFGCTAGACVKITSFCSDDGTSVVDLAGNATSCAPYLCAHATCQTSCKSSADCAAGTSCVVTTGTCEAVADAPPPSSGGCGTAPGAPVGAGGVGLGALGLAATFARRRRRRAVAPRSP